MPKKEWPSFAPRLFALQVRGQIFDGPRTPERPLVYRQHRHATTVYVNTKPLGHVATLTPVQLYEQTARDNWVTLTAAQKAPTVALARKTHLPPYKEYCRRYVAACLVLAGVAPPLPPWH
jgi:hypothetical protein